MTEIDDLFKRVGHKQIALEKAVESYNQLIDVLHAVVTKEIEPDRVTVDVVNRRYSIAPAQEETVSKDDT